MEVLQSFWDDIGNTSALVWYVALFLTFCVAWIIHAYNENALITATLAAGLYISIVMGCVGFSRLGFMFSPDKNANIVAAAGVTMCALLVMTLILARALYAMGDMRQKARYRREAQGEAA